MSEPKIYMETVEGCRTSIMRAGAGAPLLFLHGANGASRWAPFMAELAKSFDVIVPEHPGFGRSDMPEWLDTVGDLAHFYLSFMKQFDLNDVTLVGTSMGGWIASEIAVRDQSRLRKLVLVASAGLRVKGVPPADLFLWSQEELTRHLFHDQELAARLLAMPVSHEESDIAVRNRVTTARLAWNPRLYNPELEKWIHRLDLPTLVLWGRQDALLPVAYAERFGAAIKGAKVQIFEDCGHLPHSEKAPEFVAAIRQFAGEA